MKIHSIGTRLAQYEILSYLDFNDISIDYICLDHERSCPAVLKTLKPEWLPGRITRDCFAQYGAAWVGLGAHPHIVRCHRSFNPRKLG